MSERGQGPDTPSAPGWYPDPFSADGRGERYFDGKRWGTAQRPLGRHGHAEPTRLPTGTARRVRNVRRKVRGTRPRGSWRRYVQPTVVVVVFVAAAFGLAQLQHRNSKPKRITQPNLQTVTVPDPNRPPPGVGEQSRPIGKPEPFKSGPGYYEFLHFQPNDETAPVAFDPCRTIHYVINAQGAPADGTSMVQSAIARVSKATGLQFAYDGPTDEPVIRDRKPYQPDRWPGRWAPVLVAWSDAKHDPELAGYIAGLGTGIMDYGDSNHLVYVSGILVLDREDLSTTSVPDRGEARAIVLHELGHLVGLDHTNDATQLMYSESRFNVRDYGAGDLRGLAALGTQPCYPGI